MQLLAGLSNGDFELLLSGSILAGREGRALVVAPIAFVSEHSETLVELDIEYVRLARENGVLAYERAPTVDAGATYIAGLADLVRASVNGAPALCSGSGGRLCPADRGQCPMASA